jgi:DNA-binding transcriptional LysR family regulator
MKEIIKEAFVVREEGSGTKAAIRRHFKKQGFDFISSYEMSSNESIKHAVVAGLGLGIVALHTIKLELEAGKLVILNVENFPLERYWHLVSRKGRRLSPAAIEFQEFILTSVDAYQKSYEHLLVRKSYN